jgi:hypothetical protein
MKFWIQTTVFIALYSLNVFEAGTMASGAENPPPNRQRIERLLDLVQETAKEDTRLTTTQGDNREAYQRNLGRETSVTQDLVAVRDLAIDSIIERIKRTKVVESYNNMKVFSAFVIILAEIGTPRADKTLQDLALNRNTFRNFSEKPLPVEIFKEWMKKPGGRKACRIFFINDQGKPYAYALSAIEGIELNQELFDKVCSFLEKKAFMNTALRVLAAAPSTNLTEEKVAAICNSLGEIEKQPDRNRATRDNMLKAIFNKTDQYCIPHIDALVKMPGANSAIRTRIEQQTEGITRQCLRIALANRGDIPTTRESLSAFLKDPEYRACVVLRIRAVEGYSKGGEIQDLPFLRELATTDPFKEEWELAPDGPRWHKWGEEHINLYKEPAEYRRYYEAEKERIRPERFLTRYPIREAAKGAIQAIEARTENEGKSATPKPESGEREK